MMTCQKCNSVKNQSGLACLSESKKGGPFSTMTIFVCFSVDLLSYWFDCIAYIFVCVAHIGMQQQGIDGPTLSCPRFLDGWFWRRWWWNQSVVVKCKSIRNFDCLLFLISTAVLSAAKALHLLLLPLHILLSDDHNHIVSIQQCSDAMMLSLVCTAAHTFN